MATWIVGDVHGCADELAQLIDKLGLAPEDRLVSCGDLFHRGPDPAGVADLLTEREAPFVLGNHEHRVLRRLEESRSAESPSERDVAGDGGMPCHADDAGRARIARFLRGHHGYYLERGALEGAGETADGRDWVVVHAGIDPTRPLAATSHRVLTRTRRVDAPGRPWWYEGYRGPRLVLFGHTPSPMPRAHRVGNTLVALGLDTGCVYGGRLTAYSPELDEFATVKAHRAWAER